MRLKTILIAGAVVITLLAAGLFVWARSVLAGDAVRTTVAEQLTDALGEPVTIGGLGVSIFPRVTMTLSDVTIGTDQRTTIRRLHVGTGLGPLLSRRIENADLRLDGARITLPFPAMATAGASAEAPDAPTSSAPPPVELVSIDEIRLSDVEITSAGRTLRGDMDLAWHSPGLTIRSATLGAGESSVTLSGEITDINQPTGDIDIAAGTLHMLDLVAFFSDFSSPAGLTAPPSATAASTATANAASGMDIRLSMSADRATFGDLAIDSLTGQARVTDDAVTLDPVQFNLFDGSYAGRLTFDRGTTPTFQIAADVSNIDVAAAVAFAGSPGAMTGRASGRLDLTGLGVTAEAVAASLRGSARLEASDGIISGLGLVRGVVLATSMRDDSEAQLVTTRPSGSFSTMGLTLAIGGGTARTSDVSFESEDVSLAAAGQVRLRDGMVDLLGRLQLSDALSQAAGRDLMRYTQEDGRVTLPATVSGPIDGLQVRIDMSAAAQRALTNRATEEATNAIRRGLRRIIR